METRNSRCTGGHMPVGAERADVVVLANAASAGPLAATAGSRLQILEKPVVLLQFASSTCSIKHMLYGRGLELRPSRSGGLVSAADLLDTGKNGRPKLRARTASAIEELIKPPLQLATVSVQSAMMAMTLDGTPLRGFVDSVPGLYAAVAHPGVILAHRLGRLAAGDIRERAAILCWPSCPAAFAVAVMLPPYSRSHPIRNKAAGRPLLPVAA
ncbi:MAG: hypothetical protein ACN6OP_05450 [Pseudomonadales bacterium]